MKKLLVGCLALMLLAGCSSSKPLEEKYVYSFEDEGLVYEEVVTLKGTLKGKTDWLDETSSELTVTFTDDATYQEFIGDLETESEAYRACPGGNNGTDCSKYVTYDYSIEENKSYKSKETIDYKTARKNKDAVTYDQPYKKNEYFSFDKTAEELVSQGYVKQ
ncbi:hypothetical protein [Beduini massiliensis]|uniref:hypothetical protein n=1 Tax=Beduini massiliensis TaxID=1585974 RepID=UPI00059A80F6|nr:hypothetical protein [Beduini massiliensis]